MTERSIPTALISKVHYKDMSSVLSSKVINSSKTGENHFTSNRSINI